MGKRILMVGRRFGRLEVLSFEGHIGVKRSFACICDCGEIREIEGGSLRKGSTVSCGCYKKEKASALCIKRNITHGMSGTRIYKIWVDMKRRCFDLKNKRYLSYGGRGISVCKEWMEFSIFYKEMGFPKSIHHTLDRIDNNGNYYEENCRWADVYQQANNKRNNRYLNCYDQTLTMKQASVKYKINYSTLRSRLNRGWTTVDSIEKQIKR